MFSLAGGCSGQWNGTSLGLNREYEKSIVCIIVINMTNLSGFDLNLLRVLNALLREHSTVRAGHRLGLSQPAVSAALGRLRLSLGDELFFRRGQGLEPTEYALSIDAAVQELLDGVHAVLRGPAEFDPATSEASFKISASDFFAEMLMPRLADRLSLAAPFMLVHLVDLVPDSYVATLESHEVGLALVPATELPDWVESLPVFRSGFSVIARKGHPRISQTRIMPGDVIPIDVFCDVSHVMFSPEGKAKGMGDAALARMGRERRVVMTMPVFSGVYRAVSGSDLLALLPTALAHHIAPLVGLEVYRPPMEVRPAQINMIWHRRFSASNAHQWLRTQIVELLKPLDEG